MYTGRARKGTSTLNRSKYSRKMWAICKVNGAIQIQSSADDLQEGNRAARR